MLAIRRFFSALLAIGLFVFLGYVFTLFMQPQGQGGWITAVILVIGSGIVSLFVYRWLAVPGRSRHRAPDPHDDGSGLGLGLLGASSANRRRSDDFDHHGRRSDDDGGSDGEGGGSAADDPSGLH